LENKEKPFFSDPRTKTLDPYCPPGTLILVDTWLKKRKFHLRISRERVSKLGDFRPATLSQPARISVNNNLHPIEFLITLAHELAHFDCYRRFSRRRKPHGKEWKASFRSLLQEIIDSEVLSSDICDAIIRCYFLRERIASSPCALLKEELNDNNSERDDIVQDLEVGEVFELRNGRRFVKGERIRTRYKCKDLKNGKYYTIHPMAVITKINILQEIPKNYES